MKWGYDADDRCSVGMMRMIDVLGLCSGTMMWRRCVADVRCSDASDATKGDAVQGTFND